MRKSLHKTLTEDLCLYDSYCLFSQTVFKIKAAVPYSRTNLIICRLNFENISISFGAMREQPSDIHTYRQTDGTKILY